MAMEPTEMDHKTHNIQDALDLVVALAMIMSITWMGFGIAETNKQIQELRREVQMLNERREIQVYQ